METSLWVLLVARGSLAGGGLSWVGVATTLELARYTHVGDEKPGRSLAAETYSRYNRGSQASEGCAGQDLGCWRGPE